MKTFLYTVIFVVVDIALSTWVAMATPAWENLPKVGAIEMYVMFMVFSGIFIMSVVLAATVIVETIKWLFRPRVPKSKNTAPKI